MNFPNSSGDAKNAIAPRSAREHARSQRALVAAGHDPIVMRDKNGATFLIPHHAGWDEKRERGSTAIRAKSDIVLQIVKFDVISP